MHQLDDAESYLAVLGGIPQAFAPGTAFAYCNGGYVVLALLAERAARVPFHDLVQRHVIDRAGLSRTAYLRSDALPGDAALGYLHADDHVDRLRTNVLHLPVVGGGDGGIFTTAADLVTLWQALDDGRVVAPETWAEMRRVRSTHEEGPTASASGSRVTPSSSPARTPGRRSCPCTCPAGHLVGARQHHRGRLAGREAAGGACRSPDGRPTDSRLSTGRRAPGGA